MMKTTLFAVFMAASLATGVMGEISRVSNGGQTVWIEDIAPSGEPVVLVFHTPWNQESIQLLEEIQNWASQYSNLAIVFIDVVDERTQVTRQFSVDQIPSIVVLDRDHEQIGEIVDNVADMEEILNNARLL